MADATSLTPPSPVLSEPVEQSKGRENVKVTTA